MKANILLIALLIMSLITMIAIYFSHKANHTIIHEVRELKENLHKTDSALQISKRSADSLTSLLVKHSAFIQDIQAGVEVLELERRKKEKEYQSSKSQIDSRIDSLLRKIDSTRNRLPEINFIQSEKE